MSSSASLAISSFLAAGLIEIEFEKERLEPLFKVGFSEGVFSGLLGFNPEGFSSLTSDEEGSGIM